MQFSNVTHGFSTRSFGSFKSDALAKSIAKYAKALSISPRDVVCMEQVHGVRVMQAGNSNDEIVPGVDGLVGKERSQFLCVRTADCVPIIAFDPRSSVYGAVHAGWKGSLRNIATVLIEQMVEMGAANNDIRIGLGPSIRECCYSIDEERAGQFALTYPKLADTILTQRSGKKYLNLQQLVINQLQSAGVAIEHIEDSKICTHDSDEFFSYRDKNSQPGLFAGIIGVI